MAKLTQAFDDSNHAVRFDSPLGADLVVRSMIGEEEMGRLFSFQIQLLSHDTELKFDSIVGQPVTVIIDLESGERHFNGYVTEFRYVGQSERVAHYEATLMPWFWFLTRTTDCRIFQKKKVPDIIKEIFKEKSQNKDQEVIVRTSDGSRIGGPRQRDSATHPSTSRLSLTTPASGNR